MLVLYILAVIFLGITDIFAIIRSKERSLLMVLSTATGLVVIITIVISIHTDLWL